MRFASLADRAQPAVGGFGGKVLGRRSPEQARIGAAITRKWTRICNHEGPLPMSDKGTATRTLVMAAIWLVGQCTVFVRNREQLANPPVSLDLDETAVKRLTTLVSAWALAGLADAEFGTANASTMLMPAEPDGFVTIPLSATDQGRLPGATRHHHLDQCQRLHRQHQVGVELGVEPTTYTGQ